MRRYSAKESARRARAARTYGGVDQRGLAELSGVSYDNIKRVEGGTRPYDDDEKRAIAAACELPPEFFDVPSFEVYARLEEFERRLPPLGFSWQALTETAAALGRLARGREDAPASSSEPADPPPGGRRADGAR